MPLRYHREADQNNLAGDGKHEPIERLVHKTIGMQAHAQHVYTKPREIRDNVAEDRQRHQSALLYQPAPTSVQNDRAPEHNQQRSILLRVPTPKPSPEIAVVNWGRCGQLGSYLLIIDLTRARIGKGESL